MPTIKDEKYTKIGFLFKDGKIEWYFAGERNDETLIMFKVPERMLTQSGLEEVCIETIRRHYEEVKEKVEKDKGKNNAIWVNRDGEIVMYHYKKITFKE